MCLVRRKRSRDVHRSVWALCSGGEQIDQRLRDELLFRHVHSKASALLVSTIFGLFRFAKLGTSPPTGFHTYGMLVTRSHITCHVDGVISETMNNHPVLEPNADSRFSLSRVGLLVLISRFHPGDPFGES